MEKGTKKLSVEKIEPAVYEYQIELRYAITATNLIRSKQHLLQMVSDMIDDEIEKLV